MSMSSHRNRGDLSENRVTISGIEGVCVYIHDKIVTHNQVAIKWHKGH